MYTTTIDKIVRRVGVAGQYSLEVWVTYRHGPNPADADATITTSVSSVYGAPVVMVMSNGQQVPVDDWRRYGSQLDASWVRAFYGVTVDDEYVIQVYDNDDNDTGIWHKGSNLVDLVDRAAASVADVYDTEVTKVTQGISGGFVDREGRTYRYQAHLI